MITAVSLELIVATILIAAAGVIGLVCAAILLYTAFARDLHEELYDDQEDQDQDQD